MSGAQEDKVVKQVNIIEETIDGIYYKQGRYRYGQSLEMNEKTIELNIEEFNPEDPKKSKFKPRIRKDLLELFSVLNSIKEWTFRGYDDEDNLFLDESKPILPITEENVRNLPPSHGAKLLENSGKINGLDPILRKNS